jgi:hypothetical protein
MSKSCDPNQETHNFEVGKVVRGVGCTKEDATRAILNYLLAKAKRERKIKCEELECNAIDNEGDCLTTIDADDVERLEKQIKLFPIRRKGCPGGVGWLARLVAKPPQYKSQCICVPTDDDDDD